MDQETRLMTEEKSARRFLFETSFDTEPEVDTQNEHEEEQPPEPTFSQEELDAARQDGYRDGHEAGMAEALDTIEAAIAAHLESIWSQLPRIEQAQTAAHEKLARDGVSLATTITAKILPTLAMRHGTDEIEALVTDCLARLVEQPKITISVAPTAGAALTEKLDEFIERSGFEGRFVIRTEEEMGPADCRLEWGDGTATRNLDIVWSEIDATVSRFLSNDVGSPEIDDAGKKSPDDEDEAPPPAAAQPVNDDANPLEAEADTDTAIGSAADADANNPDIEPSA